MITAFRIRFSVAICLAAFCLGGSSRADWVAFNDHVPGAQTHINTTTNNIRVQSSGPLKNIASGTNLPVTLSITRSGSGVTFSGSGASPAPGTPISQFNGFVTFSSALDSNVEITNSTVTYSFTGLNPVRRYSFRGGAIRGGVASFSNRWTKVEISGADAFEQAHSAHVITSAQAPADLTVNQAAVSFAINNMLNTGDMIDWENIDPGADGSFAVVCSQYQGFVPNGGRSNGTNGYAITGIRLEELPSGPPVIITQPQDQTVSSGQSATFSVAASGRPPLSYQWYRNGSMLAAGTNSTYTTPPTTINDYGQRFSVTVFNSLGQVISSNATLSVILQSVTVLPLTNSWKYEQSGRDLGTAWQAIDYDDSGWPSGRGVLAVETDNPVVLGPPALTNTVLSLFDTAGIRVITYYFRTHFNLTDDPNWITLTASNLIDDAAVFYLNGREFFRQNLLAPPARIVYTTPANASLEAAWTSFVLPPDFLVQGDNVLAVEVHQGGSASSDIVMGMQIRGDFPEPSRIVITNEPADAVAFDGSPATFSIGFSGNPSLIQWFHEQSGSTIALVGATQRKLDLSNVLGSDGGYYFAVISNFLGQATTRRALLTVQVDDIPPRLLGADGTSANANVLVSFSETVFPPSATNPANYVVTNLTSGGLIAVTNAVLVNGTNVLLTLAAPRSLTENYLVIVSNVQDRSPHHNSIVPETTMPISILITLLRLDEPGWAFYNPVLGPPYEPFEPPTNWNQLDFEVPTDDWGIDAAGLFAYNPSQTPLPAPVNTALSGGAISSYFRAEFDFPGCPVGANLLLHRIVDDGVVAYLNGAEAYRFNLPAGPVDAFTPAASPNAPPLDSGLIDVPELPLRFGTNVFAAELHNIAASDNDLVFGAELKARILSWARGPVIIYSGPADLTVREGELAEFRFQAVGASGIQWQTNGVPIVDGNDPVLRLEAVPLSRDGTLVRVVASNATSTAVSTEVTLHVVPDRIRPQLLGANQETNGILLTFSEALLPSSATNLSHFRLTNALGETFNISSAILRNASNIFLAIDAPFPGNYRVLLHGISDTSVARNQVLPNTSATVGFDYFIPIDAAWQFRIDGVDLGTTWVNWTYNDTASPWANGAALIADETAPLPVPIRTPISRFSDGVSAYHYTFYFRRHFSLPLGATNATVTFRHIIDDGAVFYLNGTEFYRFNMPAGPINYLTQANTVVGDAAYAGPFTATLTNLLPGDNVIAVEVHQNGTASADVTFGAEFSYHIPSVLFPPNPPSLSITRNRTNVTMSWDGEGYILEQSDVLGPNSVWLEAPHQSNPYLVAPTDSGQRFFRLR